MIDLSYIAGFFDGEGSVSIALRRSHQESGKLVLVISIANTYKPILEEIRDFVGFGAVYTYPDPRPGRLPLSQLQWQRRQAYEVLLLLFPHLKVKHLQAKVGIEFQEALMKRKLPGLPGRGRRPIEWASLESYRTKMIQLNSFKGRKMRYHERRA